MKRGENFSDQVHDPVMELVVTRRGKSAPLTVKGTPDRKCGVAAVAVMKEVGGI